MSTQDVQKDEQSILALMLRNKDLVGIFLDSPLEVRHFDVTNQKVLYAILDAHEKDVQLTRSSFLNFVSKLTSKKQELIAYEAAFTSIHYLKPSRNDFPMYIEKMLESHLLKSVSTFVKDFAKNKSERSVRYAVQNLASSMQDLSLTAKQKKTKVVYEDISLLAPDVLHEITGIRDGSVENPEFISYGIPELDQTSVVGLAPGTMTLFCGDVGGYKSTMMMNVGLNVQFKAQRNVLFVPLEMPRNLVIKKIISRQTQIPFNFLNSPKTMSADQFEKLKNFINKDWPENASKMFVLDSYDERAKVSLIRRMIEKHIEIFKPRVVVIDYIANLQSEGKMERQDQEIGEMLSELRYMGRPKVMHDEGFAIVSGAQIGRDGLKRVRKSGSDKISFFSEDIRGAHDYSMYADNIYFQLPDPQQPNERLILSNVKSRYGQKTFANGAMRAMLELKPEISLIRSATDYYDGADKEEVLRKATAEEADLDFTSESKSIDEIDSSPDILFEESDSSSENNIDDFIGSL